MQNKTVFIFHGTGGNPEGNWFPWLKKKLEEKGLHVIVPQFPTPEGQSLESWLAILDTYKEHINEETIFVGHSLGGLFLLRVLERLKDPAYAAFFVSSPVGIRPIKYYDGDFAFSGFDFNWKEINNKAKHFAVWHSDNDPYIDMANGKEIATQLGVDLHFIPNAGHLNAESGWTEFPQLLEELEKVV